MRDRKMFADKDEDDEDLSPAEGEDKLPALENFVENSAYKNAIIEPMKVKNPVPPRYGQKKLEDLIKVGSSEYESYIRSVQDIADS